MIVFVLVVVATLFSSCQSQRYRAEDSSRVQSHEPNKHEMRVKTGTSLILKCSHVKGGIVWEFKPCHSNSYGICDSYNEDSRWTVLNQTRNRINFDYAEKRHSGTYRCKDKDIIKKIFIVDVIPQGYDSPPPHIAPLKMSNMTDQINIEFTIQCNVTSEIPPMIVWFKSCYRQRCDIKYEEICYCHINTSISYYRMGNIHISKFSIYNARDVDSGVYVCAAITQYGQHLQNVTIKVPSTKNQNESFSLLFLIPISLILVPFSVWLCCYRRKKKSVIIIVDQQKQLIRPVVRISNDVNEIL